MMGKTIKSAKAVRDAAAKWVAPHLFVGMMLGAVALGILAPDGVTGTGPLDIRKIIAGGVALVFFLHGANLDPSALLTGLRQWRLHFAIQVTTFVFFPLLCLAIYAVTGPLLSEPLRTGLFFLGASPSTIASSVAMTALARGNLPAAVFNASISGLIGMVLTPLLMTVLGTEHVALSLGPALRDIALQLLVPFLLGQLARPLIASGLTRHKRWIGRIDRWVIVLIVYAAFARATLDRAWSTVSIGELMLVAGLAFAILMTALVATRWSAKQLGLPRADEATLVFCGSKKSLATGAPMAQVLFADSASLGLIVLPLMVYHQLQLVVCATLARRYAEVANAPAQPASPTPA